MSIRTYLLALLGSLRLRDRAAASKDIQARLDFASTAYENVQSLIRFVDQKSGLILIVAGLFGAGYFTSLGLYLDGAEGGYLNGVLILVISFWFVSRLFLVVTFALLVFVPRIAPLERGEVSLESGMLFPLEILSGYGKEASKYRSDLDSKSRNELASEYCRQIIVTSEIYRAKHRNLSRSSESVLYAAIAWMVGITVICSSEVFAANEAEPRVLVLSIASVAILVIAQRLVEQLMAAETLIPHSDAVFLQEDSGHQQVRRSEEQNGSTTE